MNDMYPIFFDFIIEKNQSSVNEREFVMKARLLGLATDGETWADYYGD